MIELIFMFIMVFVVLFAYKAGLRDGFVMANGKLNKTTIETIIEKKENEEMKRKINEYDEEVKELLRYSSVTNYE